MTPVRGAFAAPVIAQNPVTRQILGVCSALAVTTSLATALTMGAALTAVLAASSCAISAIRRHVPTSVRLVVQITIIASLVILADQFLRAFAFEMSRKLSIFVGLIVTNCLVLGRAEGFAMHHPVRSSLLDALGNGLGYSLVLIVVGGVRELIGAGTLLGFTILPSVDQGGWYRPLDAMMLAPSAFILIGFLIWVLRSWRREQVEEAPYRFRQQGQEGRR